MMRIPSGNLCEFAQAGRELLRQNLAAGRGGVSLRQLYGCACGRAGRSANDEEYGKKIREFTTEPFFLTDLVDHLPASSTVPSPDKILGHIVGAPDFLTYSKDIYRYYDELAKASPRVKVYRVGKTEEGRDFLLVAVSDEANIAQLDHLRDITAKLADPRKISDADAKQLDRRRQAVLLGVRLDPFARDGIAGNVDGIGVPPGGGRFAVHPEYSQERGFSDYSDR